MAFIKDDPAKAAGLVAKIQKLTETNKAKDLRSFVVFMAGPEVGPKVKEVGASKSITVSMSVLPEGPGQESLARYKVNPEAKNTILVYKRQMVQANFVDVDEKSFADVEKATAEMLSK